MGFDKEKVYFVGNAHLDPIWIWEWQEGSAEAKATIRSALDRMKEYPEFIFVCSASRVFEWIEEFAPSMFEEIKERVKEGRFHIVGGWFVQPDCNNPSGEGFARHGLYAQRYFKEKFGVTARSGYNVDSFGHNANIPQLLRKAGMDRYIFMRPNKVEKELPTHIFYWEAPDGSKVLASRLTRMYSTSRHQMDLDETFDEELKNASENADPKFKEMLFFYGVGNHGGGPTKKNIETIKRYRELYPDKQLVFSNVDDYFDDILRTEADQIITIKDEMQHHASGCYAANSFVKKGIRKAECKMTTAEGAVMMAHALGVKAPMNTEKFAELWKNILFSHFHDSMGGCSIKAAHLGIDRSLQSSIYGAEVLTNNALQTISWAIDTRDAQKGIPMVYFNPHSFDVDMIGSFNHLRRHIFAPDGTEIPSQIVHAPSQLVRMEKGDTIFKVHVPAYGYATYYAKQNLDLVQDPAYGNATAYVGTEEATDCFESLVHATDNVLENDLIRVTFNKATGFIDSISDKEQQKELLKGQGAVPVVIDESEHDTWSHAKNFFDQEIGTFGDAEIKPLENGPVRAKIKVVNRYGASTLTQYFTLEPGSRELTVEGKADWHEYRKMLKLRFACDLTDPKAYYEIPFAVMERPADGEEEPGLMWIAAKDAEKGFALLNDCKYSFSVKNHEMNLTVLRSPYFIDHGRGETPDEEIELTDQGEQEFRYVFMPIDADTPWSTLVKKAKAFNEPPTEITENNHEGHLPTDFRGLTVSKDNVVLSALKRSEDGTGTVIRLYETDGVDTEVTVEGPMLPATLKTAIGHFAVDTYLLKDGETEWKKVLFTEYEA